MTFLGVTKDFNQYGSGMNNSNEVTLKELIDIAMGGEGGIYAKSFPGGLSEVLKSNIKDNAVTMATSAIAIPIAFRVGKKLLRKPIITPANRLIKMAGLGSEVRV